jgi:hypothetical protein
MILNITILFNLFVISVFIPGLFLKFENPNSKAVYGYTMAFGMLLYIITILLFIITNYKNSYVYAVLIFCLLSPFIIGKLVSYKTLKIYTIFQIICFFASFIILLMLHQNLI